jgi:hypothetical protein
MGTLSSKQVDFEVVLFELFVEGIVVLVTYPVYSPHLLMRVVSMPSSN